MTSSYIPAERIEKIKRLITQKGIVRVSELSKLFDVVEITIRRDLAFLEERGFLERTHGGAILTQHLPNEVQFEQKSPVDREAKELIGRVAAGLIEPGDTILINAGSTTIEVIKNIIANDIKVITNNAGAVNPRVNNNIEILLTGGTYRPQSNSLAGSFALDTLRKVYGSKAVIGADGISPKFGITTASPVEADFNRLLLERTTGLKIVVSTHAKFGVVSNFVTCSINEIDVIVTDTINDNLIIDELERTGIKLVLAEKEAKS